ncbi:MAG TPA: amidohydrolase family protein [Candidatus Kapabacteria bacterium]|jgi:guanine deaminase|nr:amidohydrolase family protein [Candidatus Kapabacteria bacterium]
MRKLIKGIFLNPKTDYSVEVLNNYCILINNGIIEKIEKDIEINEIQFDVFYDFEDKIIIPGLIDLHTHIPQFRAIGIGKGELLEWLNDYIFPLEAKFSEKNFAVDSTELFFKDLISKGTTTAVMYSSPQKQACEIAFEIADELSVRSFIGLPLMDRNTPDMIIQNTEQVIKDIFSIADKWHKRNKCEFVLSPRFALSCSDELLRRVGEIAASDGFFVQTHLAESKKELQEVKLQFPEVENYTSVYDKYNLLTSRTILAHCIYLNEAEIEKIRDRNCIIAHCPTSNKFLRSGIMQAKKYIDCGLKVGLGTDVAAGYSLSMLNEGMEACEVSKLLSVQNDEPNIVIEADTAFCLSTIKAAEYLGISEEVGNFEIGKKFDAAVFELAEVHKSAELKEEEYLRALMYNIDKRTAKSVFIDGNLVYHK